MTDDATPIRSEGELIETYLAPLAAGIKGAFGLQDDCAVAAPRGGHEFVFKTDAVAAGVHFLPDDSPQDIAWKALAVNVSDLAAKGAEPVGYLMSLAFPEAPTHGWMKRFADGLRAAQSNFGLHLLGGDTDRRPGPMSVTPMVIGEVPVGQMKRRGAAVAGDRIFVSGTLGDAALGLLLLRHPDLAATWGLRKDQTQFLTDRYRRPQPRLGLRPALRAGAQAAMDLSDGLVKDLGRMCRASGCGARVQSRQLPLSPSATAIVLMDPGHFPRVIAAGDDYEVLASVRPSDAKNFERLARMAGIGVIDIGEMVPGDAIEVLDAAGVPIHVANPGYDHF